MTHPEISRIVPDFQRALNGTTTDMAGCIAMLLELQTSNRAVNGPTTDFSSVLENLFADSALAGIQELSELLSWLRSLGFGQPRRRSVSLLHSHVGWVIEQREGLPIVLAVVLLEALNRIGRSGHGVDYPGHFLVRVDHQLIDPLTMQEIDTSDLSNDPGAYTEADCRTLGLRMLNNIKALHLQTMQWAPALDVLDLQLVLGEGEADIIAQLKFESAEILQRMGAMRMARSAYEACAELAAMGSELQRTVQERLAETSRAAETLH